MAQQTISAGSPPIVWSTVEEAFTKINANFDEIYATIGAELGSVVDFNSLSSNVSPSATETYDLGSPGARWRDLYLSGNSLYLGSALITANGAGVVNLPAGSTVNGELIRNPEEASFKNVAVTGQDTIAADLYTDTLNIASGNAGITITTNSTSDTLTITNSGILSIAGTLNQIGAVTVSGVTTLTNLGVLSLTGETGGIAVDSSTGNITITNLGVKRLIAGSGISITPSGGTGTVTIENTSPASPTFRTVRVDGDFINQVQADPGNFNDILNFISGAGLTITTDPATDTITFTVNSNLDIKGSVFGFDSSLIVDGTSGNITGQTITASAGFQGNLTGHLIGSVFADNSTMLVDGTSGVITGNVNSAQIRTSESKIVLGDSANAGNYSVSIGYSAGATGQGDGTVAIGLDAGVNNQGNYATAVGRLAGYNNQATQAIALGYEAGTSNQGTNAIAIGYRAGYSNQTAGSIVLNASGTAVNGAAAGFYVRPIRSNNSGRVAIYDTSTYEVSYSNLEFNGGLISTADSSGLTVDVLTTFNSDVTVENDLTVSNIVTANSFIGNVTATTVVTTELTTGKVEEAFTGLTGATGTVVHNCAANHIFSHTSIANNFTANFTNLSLESERATTVTLILVQGGTAYIPNAVEIAGTAQTILWQGSSPPSGNINKTDIVAFSILNNNGTYTVFGQLTSFGT